MPITMEWHKSLPILLATYEGDLTLEEYEITCTQRQMLLSKGPERAILLADTRQMGSFPEAEQCETYPGVLDQPGVEQALVIVKDTLYRILRQAIDATNEHEAAVCFFHDEDTAWNQAEKLIQHL